MSEYEFIDSGKGAKLERFGEYLIARPYNLAIWPRKKPDLWEDVTARFDRKTGWEFLQPVDEKFKLQLENLCFELFFSNFGHVGIFPEHLQFLEEKIDFLKEGSKVVNLFGYTGSLSAWFAKKGMEVWHVDASKTALESARTNMELNGVNTVHFLWDDVLKFCKRQLKRKATFDFIVLDPPTHGRGPKKEVFKIEKNLPELISLCSDMIHENSAILLTCHSPGMTPTTLENLMKHYLPEGTLETGELFLQPQEGNKLPSGVYALWKRS